jgi:hypothetical protein
MAYPPAIVPTVTVDLAATMPLGGALGNALGGRGA